MKTLYVYPTCQVGDEQDEKYEYWEDFIGLFNDQNPLPFEHASIEVVVTPNKPEPDDMKVIQIVCKGLTGKCPTTDKDRQCKRGYNDYFKKVDIHNYNYGHTFFMDSGWWYDTRGFTPGRAPGPIRYGTPEIYPYAIKNLFTEGAYEKLEKYRNPEFIKGSAANPCPGSSCFDEFKHCRELKQCYKFECLSPIVEDRSIIVCRLPDEKVQLGRYTFYEDTHTVYPRAIKKIWPDSDLKYKKSYNQKQIFTYVIVHEMGHALLNRIDNLLPAKHHCNNSRCIMYGMSNGLVDFDLHDFGSDCEHSPNGAMDISSCVIG
jgi:hypothetical protein